MFSSIRNFITYLRNSHHPVSLIVLGVAAISSVFGVQFTQLHLETALLTLPEPKSFDGTVYPLPLVPKWHQLTTTEFTALFADIPSDKLRSMPRYNPNDLQASISNLGYSENDNELRDAKVTYPVAYLGNYTLDGVEYAGSHPAVDVKAPIGTPIVSIANGIVVKVSSQPNGFGYHIVVKHVNVPTKKSATTTLYSSYSHMNDISVKEGQLVARGESLGTVGKTGTATTPHLHFQIDVDDAPWHPYWPFSYSDYAGKGLSFFEAINQGIGQENAIKYTINPMQFVQANLVVGGSTLSSVTEDVDDVDSSLIEPPVLNSKSSSTNVSLPQEDSSLSSTSSNSNVVDLAVVTDDQELIDSDFVESTVVDSNAPQYLVAFNLPTSAIKGTKVILDVTLKDESGSIAKYPDLSKPLTLSLSDSDVATLSDTTLSADDFVDGTAKVDVTLYSVGDFKVIAPYLGAYFESSEVNVIDDVKEVYSFKFEHDGNFSVNQPETIRLYPIDKDSRPTSYTLVGDVTVSADQGSISEKLVTLSLSDFERGYAEFSVTPDDSSTLILKARNSFVKGVSESLSNASPLFTDLSPSHPNYKAIYELKKKGVISGYPDNTFKPSKGVSRVEALKLIYAGLGADVSDADSYVTFRDVSKDEWYFKYLRFALSSGTVKGYSDGTFKPTQTVNKAEFAKMLVLALNAEISSSLPGHIADDVGPNDWYAPYVDYLLQHKYIDLVDDKFNASFPMDRAGVAEAIYRATK